MKWLVVVLVAVLVIGGGLVAGGALGLVALPRLHIPAVHHHAVKPAPVSVDVPPITTNLGGGDGSHFAQVSLTVTLADAKAAKAFNAHLPAVEDAVIADIRQSSVTQLDADGGMTVLRDAVAASMGQVLDMPGAVQAVYFTQFIVQ